MTLIATRSREVSSLQYIVDIVVMTDSIDFDNFSDIDMDFMNAADVSFDRSASSTSPSSTPMTSSSEGKERSSDLLRLVLFSEENISSTEKAVSCKFCTVKYKRRIGDSSTGNMWRHIRQHHPEHDPHPHLRLADGQAGRVPSSTWDYGGNE